jgi:hypothetical protein
MHEKLKFYIGYLCFLMQHMHFKIILFSNDVVNVIEYANFVLFQKNDHMYKFLCYHPWRKSCKCLF